MVPNKRRSTTFDVTDIRSVIDRVVGIGADLGIEFLGYTKVSLVAYGQLPTSTQRDILSGLIDYIDTFSELDPAFPRQQNEVNALRRAAGKLGIRIPEDFYTRILGDEIIEIYRLADGLQIYRNLEFMKYSSYDLATILVSSWEELFERPPEIHELMAIRAREAVQMAMATEPWMLPRHTLIERLHPDRNQFEMDMISVAPGADVNSGNRVYWISSLKVKPLGSSIGVNTNVRSILRRTHA